MLPTAPPRLPAFHVQDAHLYFPEAGNAVGRSYEISLLALKPHCGPQSRPCHPALLAVKPWVPELIKARVSVFNGKEHVFPNQSYCREQEAPGLGNAPASSI